MKQVHYDVIIRYMKYREPNPDLGILDCITYGSLEEILQKFPSFRETLEPFRTDNFLIGDNYHGIYLSSIRLTYDDVDKKCPTEEELRNYYIKNGIKSYIE